MRNFLLETLETILLAVAIFLVLHASVQNFKVEGPSMAPTLNHGEYLLVNKLVYRGFSLSEIYKVLPGFSSDSTDTFYPFHPPQRGEVLVFQFPHDPDRDFVKRIIGIPGDSITIRNGQVFRNGLYIDEPYVAEKGNTNMASIRVPNSGYFVLGDNRPNSNDSRTWNFMFVAHDAVVGKAWHSFRLPSWMPSDLGFFSRAA